MTKQELTSALAEGEGSELSREDVRMAVDVILDCISDGLAEGKRVEIRRFGSLQLRYREARRGRNPRTGDSVTVEGKYFPRFKPGRNLRERVNNPSQGVD
jgi:integration host factor subunit beta